MVVIRNQPGIACLKPLVFWALAIALSAMPTRAQRGFRGGTSSYSGPLPTQPGLQLYAELGVLVPTTEPLSKPLMVEDESCLPWDLSEVRGASVSAIRLGVPAKARSQYEKACGDYKKKKLPQAEQHVRNAIQKYSNYSAAWVMLGQVLQDEQKMNEAQDACSQPLTVDPAYLPPYLCLAGLLNSAKQWGDLVTWSDRFRGMNPAGDMYASYYRGLALFHLHKLPEAQKSVAEAIAIDSEHHQPRLYFLLGQIYGEQGDLADATLQIRQFLKFTNARQDKVFARQYLSELRSQPNAK
jgi:tetratricopeptide (TPR) repeat protein